MAWADWPSWFGGDPMAKKPKRRDHNAQNQALLGTLTMDVLRRAQAQAGPRLQDVSAHPGGLGLSMAGATITASVFGGTTWTPHVSVNIEGMAGGVVELKLHLRDGRLHREDGPAVEGPKPQWHWHGVQVPQRVIEQPGKITVAMISVERNIEVRRIMLERMGMERFVRESGAKMVCADECGVLWRHTIMQGVGRRNTLMVPEGEEVRIVEVVNSTPEPDGHFKHYFIRVPPTTRTPREGIAWSFGKTAEEYSPAVQT